MCPGSPTAFGDIPNGSYRPFRHQPASARSLVTLRLVQEFVGSGVKKKECKVKATKVRFFRKFLSRHDLAQPMTCRGKVFTSCAAATTPTQWVSNGSSWSIISSFLTTQPICSYVPRNDHEDDLQHALDSSPPLVQAHYTLLLLQGEFSLSHKC